MMADVPPLLRSRRVRLVLIAASVLGLIIGLDTLVLHLRLDPLADVRAYYDAGARLNAGLPSTSRRRRPTTRASTGIRRCSPSRSGRSPCCRTDRSAHLGGLPHRAVRGPLVRLGLRNEWTWIVSGWLAAPIAWSLAVGQAQVAVTFLLALGRLWHRPGGHLKILPVIVVIYWLGRRTGARSGGSLRGSSGCPSSRSSWSRPGRSRSSGSPTWPRWVTSRTGRVRDLTGPVGRVVIALLGLALRYAPTRAGWALSVAASVLVSPRLLLYQLSTLQAAVRPPDDAPDVAVAPQADGVVANLDPNR
jgi:hypothetical protein